MRISAKVENSFDRMLPVDSRSDLEIEIDAASAAKAKREATKPVYVRDARWDKLDMALLGCKLEELPSLLKNQVFI